MKQIKLTTSIIFYTLVLTIMACSQPQSQTEKISKLTPVQYVVTKSDTDYSAISDKNLQPFTDNKSQLMGYKNRLGKIIIQAKYDRALNFSANGTADVFVRPDFWYKINRSGDILYQSYFHDNGPDYYASGLMRLVKDGKIGFANKFGKIVIPPIYDFATGFWFSGPVAVVCKDTKYGAIDLNANIVVPLEYDAYKNNDVLSFVKNNKIYMLYQNSAGNYQLVEG